MRGSETFSIQSSCSTLINAISLGAISPTQSYTLLEGVTQGWGTKSPALQPVFFSENCWSEYLAALVWRGVGIHPLLGMDS